MLHLPLSGLKALYLLGKLLAVWKSELLALRSPKIFWAKEGHRTLDTYGVCHATVAVCVSERNTALSTHRWRCNTLPMRKLILASASENRRKILEAAGIQFLVVRSGFDEDSAPLSMPPQAYVQHLALEKARSVAKRFPEDVVLGADTVVSLGSEILNKPLTKERAREILGKLSGQDHSIFTGFAIVDTERKQEVTRVEETRVKFRALTDTEIVEYVERGEDLDKAGGYAIQGGAASFVEKVEGDLSNAIGLPLSAVLEELAKFRLP